MTGRWGLTANALKLLAAVCMVVDHVAFLFVRPTEGALYIVMRTIGKLVIPIFCFFIAEGYHHTRSVPRYALRLGVFALLSHLPFAWFVGFGSVRWESCSVLWTLLCGLLALWAWDCVRQPLLRLSAVTLLVLASWPGDWQFFGVLFVLGFGLFYQDRSKQLLAGLAVTALRVLYQCLPFAQQSTSLSSLLPRLGMLLALPLLWLYNGQRGKGGLAAKWGFYVFYPAHLLVLTVLYHVLQGA